MKLLITAENQTSKTKIPLKYKKARPFWAVFLHDEPELYSISFEEFYDNGLILEMPEKSCANGHILRLKIILSAPSYNKEFNFDVSVTGVEVLQEQRQKVDVRLVSGKEEWARLLEIFSERQHNIDNFLQAAKG